MKYQTPVTKDGSGWGGRCAPGVRRWFGAFGRLKPVRQEGAAAGRRVPGIAPALVRAGGSRRGFSLPELLVVMVIVAIASGMVALTFKAAVDSRNISLARIDVMEKARSSLDLIGREIQTAFINDMGYLTNTPSPGSICGMPCVDLRVDPGTGGYCVPPGVDLFTWGLWIPREVSGNRVDDDGDGMTDEVQMRFTGKAGTRVNGIDDDGDGLTDEDGAWPIMGADDDGDGLTDEDGAYPADMLNFTISRSREQERIYDIAEVGYTIGEILGGMGDYSTRILRRFDGLRAGDDLTVPLDGQFIGIDGVHDGTETDFTVFYAVSDPNNEVDILSFDTVGLRFTYWYFNYAVAQELEPYGGDCTRVGMTGVMPTDIDNDADGFRDPDGDGAEELLNGRDDDGDGRVDEDPTPFRDVDPAICNGPWQKVRFWESSLERYPNEPEDVNSDEITVSLGDYCDPARLQAIEHMDGLPNVVAIEIWVFDQERRDLSPRHLSTRVQIPSGRTW